ncbi:SlyX family protein [Parasalinivibrio latis]|uniref:SlyX family protein n=1 Tax=Parasalinivibrio latis TaxID=2952610 RepID=UPI0030E3E017
MTDKEKLDLHVQDLECRLAFQEQAIEELNDALSEQQMMISKMQTQITYLVSKIKAMEPSNIASMSEETPPPHY